MGQKNRRDSRGRFAQPIVSPMNPEPNPPKLVSVSITHRENNPSGVIIEETDISTNQTFGQNLGEALDQALNNEVSTNNTLNQNHKEVIMSKEVKNEVVENTNAATTTTTEAAPKKETAKTAPQKKAEATPAPAKKEEAPKAEAPKEQPIAKDTTVAEAKRDLREAVADGDDANKREVIIREEYDTGRAMLHNFGVGLAIGGGVVLGAALASGVIYLVKKQFGGEEPSAE